MSYNDIDPSNNGEPYRTDAVDIATINGGYALGWTADNEWLEYTVNVAQAGSYDFEFINSSLNGGGEISLSLGETSISNIISMPSTGSWNNYQSFKETLNLTKGTKVLRLNIIKGGFNLDKIVVKPATITGSESISKELVLSVYPNPNNSGVFNLSRPCNWEVYNTLGQSISTGNGSKINLTNYPYGIYMVKTEEGFVKLLFE